MRFSGNGAAQRTRGSWVTDLSAALGEISLLQLQRENCKKRKEKSYNLHLSGDGKIADRKNNRRNKTDDNS